MNRPHDITPNKSNYSNLGITITRNVSMTSVRRTTTKEEKKKEKEDDRNQPLPVQRIIFYCPFSNFLITFFMPPSVIPVDLLWYSRFSLCNQFWTGVLNSYICNSQSPHIGYSLSLTLSFLSSRIQSELLRCA